MKANQTPASIDASPVPPEAASGPTDNVRPPSPGTPKPPVRKLLSLGTATVALATVAQIVGHIEKITEVIVKLVGLKVFKNLHLVMTVLVVIALLIGYAAAMYAIYVKVRNSPLRIRLTVMTASTLIMLILAAGSFALIPPAPDPYVYQASKVKEWSERLLAHPTASGGIAVNFLEAQAPPQVWTTAQVLRAVLVSPVDITPLAPNIRAAFDYIDNARIRSPEGGWGYFEDWSTGVTEAAGWVCIAQLASLDDHRRKSVWSSDRVSEMVQRTTRVANLLLSSQQDDGGWGPTIDKSSPGLSRTYSTLMATWCLLEADGAPALPSTNREQYEKPVHNGLTWLISNYRRDLGWVPNPNRKVQDEPFLGLSAQTLYVLVHAQTAPKYNYVSTLPNTSIAKTAFLDFTEFEQRPLGANNRLHDGDRYMRRAATSASAPVPTSCPPFTIESSTFLWFPWSLALTRALAVDQTLPQEQRTKAAKLSETLTGRLSQGTSLIDSGFNYVMAEFLIGLSEPRPNTSRGSRH
jgi:hypothetical protein